jgi:tRNA-2-methylthio-N6-dimethylallyladenosine synthase
VLLNTCSVREKAEQKLRSEVGRLGLLKQRRPSLVIGVAGCVAQQEGEALLKAMPQVDLVIGPDNIAVSRGAAGAGARQGERVRDGHEGL